MKSGSGSYLSRAQAQVLEALAPLGPHCSWGRGWKRWPQAQAQGLGLLPGFLFSCSSAMKRDTSRGSALVESGSSSYLGSGSGSRSGSSGGRALFWTCPKVGYWGTTCRLQEPGCLAGTCKQQAHSRHLRILLPILLPKPFQPLLWTEAAAEATASSGSGAGTSGTTGSPLPLEEGVEAATGVDLGPGWHQGSSPLSAIHRGKKQDEGPRWQSQALAPARPKAPVWDLLRTWAQVWMQARAPRSPGVTRAHS